MNQNRFTMKEKVPRDIEKYQKHYSENGLVNKIGKVCKKAGMKVIYYVLLLYYVLKDESTSAKDKMIIIGALGYFILPVDLIPDFIPLMGFTDDAGALLACIKTISANITPAVKRNAAQKLCDWFADVEYGKVEEFDEEIDEQN